MHNLIVPLYHNGSTLVMIWLKKNTHLFSSHSHKHKQCVTFNNKKRTILTKTTYSTWKIFETKSFINPSHSCSKSSVSSSYSAPEPSAWKHKMMGTCLYLPMFVFIGTLHYIFPTIITLIRSQKFTHFDLTWLLLINQYFFGGTTM